MARRAKEKGRISDELLDELLAGEDPAEAFRNGELLSEMRKAVAERALNAEMDHHLSGAGAAVGQPPQRPQPQAGGDGERVDDRRPLDAPRWLGLPDRTRRRATVLMARMLLEHRVSQAGEAETGTGGESGDV